ncbi:MAG: ZIP family metal transporter [Candidatus Nanohaloarchaea archaeon]
MALLENLLLVLVAGLITDLATGIGALPFFFKQDFSDSWLVALWGLASGIMFFASVFGLIPEGLASGTILEVSIGLLVGVVLVEGASRLLDEHELDPGTFEQATFRKMVLILGVLTVHSFPEGVAIGVAFAELGFEGGVPLLGFVIPPLAILMTVAISIHNIPEGIAISIPFRAMGMNRWKMLGATIFSSVPQPIGAVIAFIFVRQAKQFMPIGFGFAAGAMIYLVITEFIEEAREQGEELDDWRKAFTLGILAGLGIMLPLFVFL